MKSSVNHKQMRCAPNLIFSQASDKGVEVLINGTMKCKQKSILLSTHTERAKILHCDIFWFSLHDEEFVSKTINDSNVDLEKFPESKVRQLAKKMESTGYCTPYQTSDW